MIADDAKSSLPSGWPCIKLGLGLGLGLRLGGLNSRLIQPQQPALLCQCFLISRQGIVASVTPRRTACRVAQANLKPKTSLATRCRCICCTHSRGGTACCFACSKRTQLQARSPKAQAKPTAASCAVTPRSRETTTRQGQRTRETPNQKRSNTKKTRTARPTPPRPAAPQPTPRPHGHPRRTHTNPHTLRRQTKETNRVVLQHDDLECKNPDYIQTQPNPTCINTCLIKPKHARVGAGRRQLLG